ncbi:hypothetical protein M407DRAFT_11987 [Tulasnella calospora MUT 4182]|uniref:Prephenate dehydratase domain-containing protein n=1 Tax=Tulasnella calospora MUT 4182 TaxID=1051891 RepID=A0A0C3K9Y0_9AGAM|nr:hypothetical protein M407DRAFT_11987 [Tulasnella calospora MUT 4182]
MTAEESPNQPVLAYLGPEGTYTHQAANDYFAEGVSYISCQTIASAFHALGGSAHIAFLPIENSTHGAVIETLDLLRLASSENQFIRGEALASISHCLVVRKGTKWENIQTVLSHEQVGESKALGQCSAFIKDRLPSARTVKTVSTAAAAQQVLRDSTSTSAAICSSFCTRLYLGLALLAENIQDSAANVTRFIVLSAPHVTLPSPTASGLPSEQPRWCAMLRITPSPAHSLNLGDVFAAIQPLAIARVDRRPSLSPTLFQDTYFFKVRDGGTSTDLEWEVAVNAAASRLLTKIPPGETDCSVLGIWKAR